MAAAAVVACLVAADVWVALAVRIVDAGDDGVALLAALGAVWLLWRGRATLVPGGAGVGAAVLLALVVVAACIGAAAGFRFVEDAAKLALLPAAVALWATPRALPVLLSAWVALAFALPVPGLVVEHVAVPLQIAEARAVELVALLFGFEVARDGVVVVLAGTPVRIDEGCSGFTLLWPALLACWVAVDSVGLRWDRAGLAARLVTLALAVPVVLVANFLRLVISVLAYAHVDPELAARVHDGLGWLLVVAAGATPFVLLGEPSRARPAPAERWTPSNSALLLRSAALAAALLAVAGPEMLRASPRSAAADLDRHLEALPWRLDAYVGARRALPERELEILGADAVVHRAYVDLATGEEVLFVAAWHRDAGRAEGHGAARCYRARGWQLDRVDQVDGSVVGARTERFLFRRPGARITVFEAVLDGPARRRAGDEAADGGRLRVLLVMEGRREDGSAASVAARFVAALDATATGAHG